MATKVKAAVKAATKAGAEAEAAKAAAPKAAALATHAAAVTYTEKRTLAGKLASAEAVTGAFLYLCQAPAILADVLADKRPKTWLDWKGRIEAVGGKDKAERWATATRKFAALHLDVSPAAIKHDVANGVGSDLEKLISAAAKAIATAREAGGYARGAEALAGAMLERFGSMDGLNKAFKEKHGRATGGGAKAPAAPKAPATEAEAEAPAPAPASLLSASPAAIVANAAEALKGIAERFGADSKAKGADIEKAFAALLSLASGHMCRVRLPQLLSDELHRRDAEAEAAKAAPAPAPKAAAPAPKARPRLASAAEVAGAEAEAAKAAANPRKVEGRAPGHAPKAAALAPSGERLAAMAEREKRDAEAAARKADKLAGAKAAAILKAAKAAAKVA